MYIGHCNPNVIYELNGKELKSSDAEMDLGVLISKDLKPAQHTRLISAEANKIVGLIKGNFTHMDEEMCRALYCSLVRPHLQYWYAFQNFRGGHHILRRISVS